MRLGRVVGSVVSTVKVPSLAGRKLLLVHDLDDEGSAVGLTYVAVDAVGAGVGSHVLVVHGTPAAWAVGEDDLPIDAAIVAILDQAPSYGSSA